MPVRLSELVEGLAREVEAARVKLALASREMARDLRVHGLSSALAVPAVQITRATFDLQVAVAEAVEAPPSTPTAAIDVSEAVRRAVEALPERREMAELFAGAPRLAELWKLEAAAMVTVGLEDLPADMSPAGVARLAAAAAGTAWLTLVADERAGLRLRDIRRLSRPEVRDHVVTAVRSELERDLAMPRPTARPAAGLRVLVTADELREAGSVGRLHLEIEEDGLELRALAGGPEEER